MMQLNKIVMLGVTYRRTVWLQQDKGRWSIGSREKRVWLV